jgi:hypothetical protein
MSWQQVPEGQMQVFAILSASIFQKVQSIITTQNFEPELQAQTSQFAVSAKK